MASKGKSGAEALDDVQTQQPGTDPKEVESPGLEDAVVKPGDTTVRGTEETTDQHEQHDVNDSVTDEDGRTGFVDEGALTDAQIVQRRTSTIDGGPEWPADGRYRKVFHIQAARVSTRSQDEATTDWRAEEYDAMHRANEVATLQEAINRGLHPRGPAELEDAPEANEDGFADLVYSVDVVPASSEAPEDAALAYTPSAALVDMGGSTLPQDGENAPNLESDRLKFVGPHEPGGLDASLPPGSWPIHKPVHTL